MRIIVNYTQIYFEQNLTEPLKNMTQKKKHKCSRQDLKDDKDRRFKDEDGNLDSDPRPENSEIEQKFSAENFNHDTDYGFDVDTDIETETPTGTAIENNRDDNSDNSDNSIGYETPEEEEGESDYSSYNEDSEDDLEIEEDIIDITVDTVQNTHDPRVGTATITITQNNEDEDFIILDTHNPWAILEEEFGTLDEPNGCDEFDHELSAVGLMPFLI